MYDAMYANKDEVLTFTYIMASIGHPGSECCMYPVIICRGTSLPDNSLQQLVEIHLFLISGSGGLPGVLSPGSGGLGVVLSPGSVGLPGVLGPGSVGLPGVFRCFYYSSRVLIVS